MSVPVEARDRRRGYSLGVLAYLIWGFAALYWVETRPVPVADLIAHRAVWSVPFLMLCLALAGGGRLAAAFALLRKPRTVGVLACAALCAGGNWAIFLWAVTHEQATAASLGYFLVPLVNVVIGLTLFRESIVGSQRIAVGLAVLAVVIQVVHLGGLPLVALGLPLTFGLYGAIRKAIPVEATEGLLLETLMMLPFALAWLFYSGGAGMGLYGLKVDLFLLGSGAFTAIPLMAYVAASRLMPLTALGLVFYIGPSVQLGVAVLLFGEPFDLVQLVAFSLVWLGLGILSLDSLRGLRRVDRA